jgi:hypothetical protein
MLRITPQRVANSFVLKLEGGLVGPWVAELDATWKAAIENSETALVVDLNDVCSIDEAGRALLAEMHREGARLVTRGCFMSELVREIAQAARIGGRN